MNKYIFFDYETGLPSYVATPANSGIYESGKTYGKNVAIKAPEDSVDNDSTILDTYHWTGSEIGTHEPKSDSHLIWDKLRFVWKEPDDYLQIIKDRSVNLINNLTGQKILSRYPQHKQTNMLTRAVELQSLNLTDSVEWQAIQTAWAWIKSVREASNATNSEINLATTVAEIRIIDRDFVVILENL